MRAMQDKPDAPKAAGGTLRWFAAFLAVGAAVAGFEIYSLVAHNRERAAAALEAHAPAKAPSAGPIGSVDAPRDEAVVGPRATVSGWALDPAGIRAVEIRVDGRVFAARIGIPRPDVAKLKSDIPDNAKGGYEFVGDFS